MENNTIQELLNKLYQSISFIKGEEANFNELRNLFHDEAVLIEYIDKDEGSYNKKTIEEHINELKQTFINYPEIKAAGFIEREIDNEILIYGPTVCVHSKYYKEYTFNNEQRVSTGINVIQFADLNGKIKVISMCWYE